MNQLKRYSELIEIIATAQEEMQDIKDELQTEVSITGSQVSAYGYTAKMKDGRKLTDHQAAARSAGVEEAIIEKHTSIPKPKTSWAKVTKDAKVSKDILAQHTTQAPASFIIVAAA